MLACVLDCIVSIIEDLVRYFNHWAYCQVAIYGKSYCEAGKATWNLFKTVGLDAIIQDNFIDSVLTVTIVLNTMFCFGVGYVIALVFYSGNSPDYLWICAIAAGLVACYMTVTVVEVRAKRERVRER
eukprot:Lithocolla_globosa_v1_NODE_784_length_3286_cov_30.816042.p3 type:complete len:127 gc:universal NODE_784_length_3286_cov_30.816042:2489-2109(-)